MQKYVILLFGTTLILLLSLDSCGSGKRKSLNPNGDSELALLMREMYNDGMRTKQELIEGKQPDVLVKYHQIHTAKATEPQKVATPNFTAFANAYEASVQSFLESNTANRAQSYQTMINNCMNCHRNMCPGPTDKIKHLFLSETQLTSLTAVQN